ncbi:hypothetical protein ACIHFD_53915 [Nonomuraea sp. NPDC051941]
MRAFLAAALLATGLAATAERARVGVAPWRTATAGYCPAGT